MSFKLLKTVGCAEEMRSVSKGRFGCAEPDWCTSIRDALRRVCIGKTALAAAALCVATAPSPSLATDLEGFYFRYDFSGGTSEFIGSASQSADPCSARAVTGVGAYGQDGVDTAFHVSVTSYGSDTIGGGKDAGRAVLAGDWTLAMSVQPGNVDKCVLLSLGRSNENDCKAVFIASSSTPGKLYAGTGRKKLKSGTYSDSGRELAKEWELTTSADLTTGYHAIVLSHATDGKITIYVDGVSAGTIDTTENADAATCVFGNGIQFNQVHGGGTYIAGNDSLGYKTSENYENVAFQDVRFYSFAFTAEDAAAYAALYPATLPGFSNLDQYAYVQSYGANAVNPGYLVKTDTTFAVDFEYTEISKQARIFGCYSSRDSSDHSNDGLSSGLYINGTGNGQFAFAKFSKYVSGGTWMTFAGQPVGDTKRRVFSTKDVSVSETTGTLSLYDRSDAKSGMTTADHGTGAINPIYLFANNSKNGDANYNSNAKIYSFGASEGTVDPAIFLAPAEENDAAGFRDIVSGAFYGDIVDSPSQALTYQSGIGQASDYRYRSGKFYARIYAVSADASKGLVKFGGEAAGTTAQFTARGRTAKISAVLPSGGTPIVEWSGDTWAITDGTIYDSTITVKSDTAIRLVATVSEAPVWTNNDGTGSLDSAENWTRMPGSGEDAVLELSGDTAITCAEAKTFGKLTIKGAYSADFSGAETITLSDIELGGLTNLVTGGKMQFPAINIPSGCTVTITGAEGLADGGLTGTGTLVVDPGTDNTFTMSKENNSFTGEAVVKSGVVRLGNATSFGPLNRANSIRVKGGATLDEGDAASSTYQTEKNKVILEEGASFVYSGTNTDPKTHAVTTLTLEGNATVDTSIKDVAIGRHYNYDYSHIKLGANTLTVTGGNTFYISDCQISGTGTIDIQEGTTVASTHIYLYNGYPTTCANGTIRIREGGTWRLLKYQDNYNPDLSTKNLILDGQVVRDENTYNLTVTGQITGNGTTPMLKMGADAVFKPTGTGYLTITESLSGTMTIDPSGLDLSGVRAIPLFKTGRAEMLPAENEIAFVAGFDTKGLRLRKTRDGLGYDLAHTGFTILVR